MTKTAKPKSSKQKFYTRDLGDGVSLVAEVSPCVFMYPRYPLQLTVTLRGSAGQLLGQVHPVDRTKHASTYTDYHASRLLANIRITPCPRCSTPAFDPASVQTNRGGLCEPCFMADLEAEWAKADEAERQKLAARDLRMKNKGMTIRVTAWVHRDAGDDYQITWYLKEKPIPEQITVELNARGSEILDDYDIIEL